jgi:uncharacterized protein with PIN domain
MSQLLASDQVAFLTDENIFAAITRWLRAQGFDVRDVREAGLAGTSDRTLMKLAQQEQRSLPSIKTSPTHCCTHSMIISA